MFRLGNGLLFCKRFITGTPSPSKQQQQQQQLGTLSQGAGYAAVFDTGACETLLFFQQSLESRYRTKVIKSVPIAIVILAHFHNKKESVQIADEILANSRSVVRKETKKALPETKSKP